MSTMVVCKRGSAMAKCSERLSKKCLVGWYTEIVGATIDKFNQLIRDLFVDEAYMNYHVGRQLTDDCIIPGLLKYQLSSTT